MSTHPALICLDLDGTLEDSRVDMVAAISRTRAAFGVAERAYEELVPHVSKGMKHLYLNAFDDVLDGAAVGSDRFAEVKAAYDEDYLAHVADGTRVYGGVADALLELSAHGPLCVVTNKLEHVSRVLLEEIGLASHFKAVVGGDSCAKEKPDPMVLEEAARRCGLDPHEGQTIMIGDSAGDVKTAKAFGAVSIWCAWGYKDSPGDEKPDLVAELPRDLPQLVHNALVGL
jgi:phosphoglycolate phosphatase